MLLLSFVSRSLAESKSFFVTGRFPRSGVLNAESRHVPSEFRLGISYVLLVYDKIENHFLADISRKSSHVYRKAVYNYSIAWFVKAVSKYRILYNFQV